MYYRCSLHPIQVKCLHVIPSPEEATKNMLIGNDVCQGRIASCCLLLRVWRRRTRWLPGTVKGIRAVTKANFRDENWFPKRFGKVVKSSFYRLFPQSEDLFWVYPLWSVCR